MRAALAAHACTAQMTTMDGTLPVDLTVTRRQEDGRTILHLVGEIDVSTAPRVRDELSRVIADGSHDLIVDLSDVPFLDSTGLGVLVGRLKAVRLVDGDLVLAGAQERTLRNFKITGLDKVFHLYDSVDAALAAKVEPDAASSM